ncbi:hypothetical protein [Epilithonimonas vandammei]|uniref:hypothetical protein n=1 Tax=Epilithonimonas vandammei TaxID=2487072 RepID=UPI0028AAC829|nr:hypothetical protein [Epilithonimonas vandammei]
MENWKIFLQLVPMLSELLFLVPPKQILQAQVLVQLELLFQKKLVYFRKLN